MTEIHSVKFAGLFGPSERPLRRSPLAGCDFTLARDGLLLSVQTCSRPCPEPVSGPVAVYIGVRPVDPLLGDLTAGRTEATGSGTVSGSWLVVALAAGNDRLVLARDGMGSLPLYIHEDGKRTAFSNDLDLLRELLGGAPSLDGPSLVMFLEHLFIPAPFTAWEGVRQLMPGERRSYHPGSGKLISRVLRPRLNPRLTAAAPQVPGLTGAAALAAFDRAIRTEMESALDLPGPHGLLLSGGKDSASLLLACPEAKRPELSCFSFASSNRSLDESPVAARLASEFGHPWQVFNPTPQELNAALRHELAGFEQPIGDPKTVGLAAMARRIGSECRLLLEGSGGASLFGTPPSGTHRRYGWLRHLPGRRTLLKPLAATRLRRCLRPAERFYLSWNGVIGGVDCRDHGLTDERWSEAMSLVGRGSGLEERSGTVSQVWSGAVFHSSSFITRVTPVDVWYPWLGPVLTETVFGVARSELWRGNLNKWLLRRWLAAYAPPYISGKPKGDFSVPVTPLLRLRRAELETWRREPHALAQQRAGVPADLIQAVIGAWRGGQRRFELAVWAILVLEEWVRAHTP